MPILGLLLAAAIAVPVVFGDTVDSNRLGLHNNIEFTSYSPLSRSTEFVRRTMSPLVALRVAEEVAREQKRLREQPIDLSDEKFSYYVPADVPAEGFSLLVFVPPWEDATVPSQWLPILDRHAMILVTAARSGNEASVLERREPLALDAAQNMIERYTIDPKRVYVGGFSGGARVALRLALAYPDIFHGVLLSAGSDPIGNAQIPLPAQSFLTEFQDTTQVVYLTGERDEFQLNENIRSRQSLKEWCVFSPPVITVPRQGHERPDASSFNQGLDALLRTPRPEPKRLAACRERIESALEAQLNNVQELANRSRLDDARKLLEKIDANYAGLAAPRSVELFRRWMPIGK